MIFTDCIQNSDEWFELRKGKFTASTFKDLFYAKAPTKGYYDTIYQVVFERLTGESPESFQNGYMKRGQELEPEARKWYEYETFNLVDNGGFCQPENLKDWVGASPDGLISNDGLLEIKCPAYSTMIEYMLKKELPSIYYYQVHGQMYCTDRKWCDFVAYHPKLTPFITRIERNEQVIKEIETKLIESISFAQTIMNKLK
jgi:putative phage-type endonuclease